MRFYRKNSIFFLFALLQFYSEVCAHSLGSIDCEICFFEKNWVADNRCISPFIEMTELFQKVLLRDSCENNELFLYLRVSNAPALGVANMNDDSGADSKVAEWLNTYINYNKACIECCDPNKDKKKCTSKETTTGNCAVQLPYVSKDLDVFQDIIKVDSIKDRGPVKKLKSAIEDGKKKNETLVISKSRNLMNVQKTVNLKSTSDIHKHSKDKHINLHAKSHTASTIKTRANDIVKKLDSMDNSHHNKNNIQHHHRFKGRVHVGRI